METKFQKDYAAAQACLGAYVFVTSTGEYGYINKIYTHDHNVLGVGFVTYNDEDGAWSSRLVQACDCVCDITQEECDYAKHCALQYYINEMRSMKRRAAIAKEQAERQYALARAKECEQYIEIASPQAA